MWHMHPNLSAGPNQGGLSTPIYVETLIWYYHWKLLRSQMRIWERSELEMSDRHTNYNPAAGRRIIDSSLF